MSRLRELLLTLLVGSLGLFNADHVALADEGGMKGEVEGAIRAFTSAYAARDVDAVMAAFSNRDDVMIYGTGADEKRVGRAELQAQVERDWAQSDAAEIVIDWMNVSGSGDVAWVAIDGKFHVVVGEQEMNIPVRATMVLEKEKGSWKIAQGHFSTPAAFQEEGESY